MKKLLGYLLIITIFCIGSFMFYPDIKKTIGVALISLAISEIIYEINKGKEKK